MYHFYETYYEDSFDEISLTPSNSEHEWTSQLSSESIQYTDSSRQSHVSPVPPRYLPRHQESPRRSQNHHRDTHHHDTHHHDTHHRDTHTRASVPDMHKHRKQAELDALWDYRQEKDIEISPLSEDPLLHTDSSRQSSDCPISPSYSCNDQEDLHRFQNRHSNTGVFAGGFHEHRKQAVLDGSGCYLTDTERKMKNLVFEERQEWMCAKEVLAERIQSLERDIRNLWEIVRRERAVSWKSRTEVMTLEGVVSEMRQRETELMAKLKKTETDKLKLQKFISRLRDNGAARE